MRQANIGKIDGIQILRAVAVLLVAWLHAGQMLGAWRVVELPHFGAFGIDIFFVISGFIMSSILLRNREEPGTKASWRFLKRRLIRIYPIYWIFASLEFFRLTLSYRHIATPYLSSFLLLPGLFPRYPLLLGVSWTMVFEMFFYYTLAALLLLTVKRAVGASIVFLGVAVLLGEIFHPRFPLWMLLSNPILLEFICGAIIALVFYRFAMRKRLGIAILIIGVAGSFFIQSHQQLVGAQGLEMVMASQEVMRRVLTWGVAATLIVLGMVFWSPSIESPAGRFAVALGDSSYSAYLASPLVIEFAGRMLLRHNAPSLGKEILFQFLIVAAVLFVGWISYEFVEWPMIHRLQQIMGAKAKC